MPKHFEKMGRILGQSLYEYIMMRDQELKTREIKIIKQIKTKKKKGKNKKGLPKNKRSDL